MNYTEALAEAKRCALATRKPIVVIHGEHVGFSVWMATGWLELELENNNPFTLCAIAYGDGRVAEKQFDTAKLVEGVAA